MPRSRWRLEHGDPELALEHDLVLGRPDRRHRASRRSGRRGRRGSRACWACGTFRSRRAYGARGGMRRWWCQSLRSPVPGHCPGGGGVGSVSRLRRRTPRPGSRCRVCRAPDADLLFAVRKRDRRAVAGDGRDETGHRGADPDVAAVLRHERCGGGPRDEQQRRGRRDGVARDLAYAVADGQRQRRHARSGERRVALQAAGLRGGVEEGVVAQHRAARAVPRERDRQVRGTAGVGDGEGRLRGRLRRCRARRARGRGGAGRRADGQAGAAGTGVERGLRRPTVHVVTTGARDVPGSCSSESRL